VTGTGALVHRLIFGATKKDGKLVIMRDWELLQILNTITPPKTVSKFSFADSFAETERLKQEFDADLSRHAPTLRRPVSWLLLLPRPS
jgi:hypothetical protein